MMHMRKTVSALLAVVMICGLISGCGKKAEEPTTQSAETTQAVTETTQPATTAPVYGVLTVEAVEEQGDMMVVVTSFGQVKYPYAFADMVQVKAQNNENVAALEFSAVISGEEYPVFTLWFGSDAGIALGTLAIEGEAEPRAVSAEFATADAAALGEKANAFFAVQECFNDVAASLQENSGFTPAG